MMAIKGLLEEPLRGWKSIAGYIGVRDVKTAMKYAEDLGMPVFKLGDTPQSPVFAYPKDLDAWVKRRMRPARS